MTENSPAIKDETAIEQVRAIIRPELNIEKHADFIFAPSHSKRIREPRKKMWATEIEGGRKAASYLLIEPIYGGKTPTTKTRKVYLVLVKLWEARTRDDDVVVFSVREIADELGIKWAGKKTAEDIYREIQTLRATMFTWRYSFLNAEGKKVDLLDHVNILDRFSYVALEDRDKISDRFQSMHAIRFSEVILSNLKANRTKPTNIEVILAIKGELAAVLYARLDIILADKLQYERTSKGLFEDIQIDKELEYRYPAGRKRILDRAIREINGKAISTGILDLRVEKTVDGSDWKLVARKLPALPKSNTQKLFPKRKLTAPANPQDIVSMIGKEIGNVVGWYPEKQRLYELFAIHYPANLIYQAIAEFKADVKKPTHTAKIFTAIMHRLAHQQRFDWIKACPPDCKYREKLQGK